MRERVLERVLIVDDKDEVRRIAEIALGRVGGLEVCACEGGTEALEMAPDFEPDVIVLDVMMPGMDGLEVLEALAAHPDLGDVPVVFLTAKAQRWEVDEYLERGAVGTIKKPFEPMTLADELREIWEAHRAAGRVEGVKR